MKKNLFLAAILCIGLTALFNSCVKDTFTEQDAYNEQRKAAITQDSIAKSQMELEAQLAMEQALLLDSLKNVGGVINYSVGVVVASESSWLPTDFMDGKGSKGLDGATVTVAQHGRIFTVTTDASGIASFKDLRIGTANVNIRKTGYTTVDYVVDLPPLILEEYTALNNGEYSNETTTLKVSDIVRHGATMIPVFSLTDNLSTITGIVTAESDLTNETPEPVANTQVKAIIDVEDDQFFDTYLYAGYTKGKSPSWFDFYGYVRQIAFGSMVTTATTGTDGSFTLQVPSSPQGLPIKIRTDEFALNQQLLQGSMNLTPVWGVQSVRTLFGWDMGYSDVPKKGLDWGKYQSAYVEFSAPTGAAAPQPTTEAEAYAVLTSSGIVSVNITDPGEGYTQPPKVQFSNGSVLGSVQAEGTALVSNGKVTGVDITSGGSGYRPNDLVSVTFTEGIEEQAQFNPEFSFSVLDVDLNFPGSGYGSTAPAITITGSGTGATAHADMRAGIKEINMTALGSNYTDVPKVVISDNFHAWEDATAYMTVNNPLFSIAYDGNNSTLWPASPAPTVTVNGDGAGATASVTLSSTGKLTGVTIGAGGSGYTSAPVVTFTGGGGFGAAGYATIATGAVTGVVITDPGQGYTSAPTVAFSGGAGTGATGTATIGFPVASIAMTAAGNGYNSISSIPVTNGTLTVDYSGYCAVKYNMGVRSISTDNDGYNFTAAPTISFVTIDGNGSGAAATAVLDWYINDIIVDTQGSGYKENDLSSDGGDLFVMIAPPAGAGQQATATAVLGNGKLAGVAPVQFGEGYTAAPNVFMTWNWGDGPETQPQLTATVSDGHVTGLTITDPGSGIK